MSIADVPGVKVGHHTEPGLQTGCTVLLFGERGAVCGVSVGGGAPGTRETDALKPGRAVARVHAICLSGGSAFGLSSADGVMRYLRERGIGFGMAGTALRVPIVPSAIIFDLLVGEPEAPGPEAGFAACLAAERAEGAVVEGRVGAGTGATVGKLLGWERRAPGGVGTASVALPHGGTVGALAVVNCVGDVVDEEGRIVAGSGGWEAVLEGRSRRPAPEANTTLGVVATDAGLDRAGARRLAEVAQDALALAIRPTHTIADGDLVFAVSTGERGVDPLVLGVAAT